MSRETPKRQVVEYWLEKARQALDSAESEFSQERFDFAANRAYYAAFYAASAVLLARGLKFSRHSGVRAAVHKELAKSGLISTDLAQWYDQAFDARQKGDYGELISTEQGEAKELIDGAEKFVRAMKSLLPD